MNQQLDIFRNRSAPLPIGCLRLKQHGAKRLRPEALDERKEKPEQPKAPSKDGKGIQ